MNYAGVGMRFVATVIDTAILLPAFYVLAVLGGQTTEGGFELSGMPFFIALALGIAYYTAFEALRGATPGKMAVGLEVRRDDGGAIGWSESVLRNVLRVVDGLFLYLVAAILAWTSGKRQRLGDRVASTVVVRRAASAAEQPLTPGQRSKAGPA